MNKIVIINELNKLNLIYGEYSILGSSSLVLRNIKENANDIDLQITIKAYNDLKKRLPIKVISNKKGIILDENVSIEYSVVSKKEIVIQYFDGFPLQNIFNLLENKKKRGLPKDILDVELISEYLEKEDFELLDLYDKYKNKTNSQVVRSKKNKMIFPENRFIKIVVIFIENTENMFLFQKTSRDRGNIWATTGGHVKAGVTSIETIKSEVFEELGLEINQEDFIFVNTLKIGQSFQDIYYIKKDMDIQKLNIQVEEVSSVRWLSLIEITKLIENKQIRQTNIPLFLNLLDTLILK